MYLWIWNLFSFSILLLRKKNISLTINVYIYIQFISLLKKMSSRCSVSTQFTKYFIHFFIKHIFEKIFHKYCNNVRFQYICPIHHNIRNFFSKKIYFSIFNNWHYIIIKINLNCFMMYSVYIKKLNMSKKSTHPQIPKNQKTLFDYFGSDKSNECSYSRWR